MPKREDIHKILVIGSGPIVIGQACEFDYSGCQAVKSLREDGYEVVLINSNPATIMTDPELANRTYIEPITVEFLEKIIAAERPDALLATLGGQTGLNCAVECAKSGILDKYGVELIGADLNAIEKGENRKLFNEAMERIGLKLARHGYAYSLADAQKLVEDLGYPVVIRPSFTMGGAGGGIAYNADELKNIVTGGIDLSPIGEVLIEESVIGWKEIEAEVMRDSADNTIMVCGIENFDAMGVHTGDSITVAPIITLSDEEVQRVREASFAIMREIGISAGGSNMQFALNPDDGRMIVIEMNPRVSRSSALASKATGFPIAKIAAKLAVGYTLDEIPYDAAGTRTANFDPQVDYVVVKVPRWAFEKFKGTDETLTTSMKSVGEVMALGRNFNEALGKALRSLEDGRAGLGADGKDSFVDESNFNEKLTIPNQERPYYIAEALRRGMSVERVCELTRITPWFIEQLAQVVALQESLRGRALDALTERELLTAKQQGLSDIQIATLSGTTERQVRARRHELGVTPGFRLVDTYAGDRETDASYYYKTYDAGAAPRPATKPRAVILGAGPNRIGQGIEFDYCCVHAAYALADAGFETVMVNCNPETVSTDYDTSDRLYFEPLSYEDVSDILEVEDPAGVLVTFGGQTPLKLARPLEDDGWPMLGTRPEAIDLAEDRQRFSAVLDELGVAYPPAGSATSLEEARAIARRLGFPLMVRPSYVLGGRGMVIAYDEDYLESHLLEATRITPDHPVLLDHFLESAIEVDCDVVCDGTDTYIGGIMEHIEEAGIHSGDSACCIPQFTLAEATLAQMREIARRLALRLGVLGLMNIQFAVKESSIYVLEVNPRASRTIPFVSKATGVQLAKIAARVMAGEKLADMSLPPEDQRLERYCVKEAVMPFNRFPGADSVLGPEMKSTGEVMGSAADFPRAFAKCQLAINYELPTSGTAFISVCDRDKRAVVGLALSLRNLGFDIIATRGTAQVLQAAGISAEVVLKKQEGRPNIIDRITNGEIDLIINTPFGQETRSDGYHIRAAAIRYKIINVTALSSAMPTIQAIAARKEGGFDICALQDF